MRALAVIVIVSLTVLVAGTELDLNLGHNAVWQGTVMVDTNSVLSSPTNFFAVNRTNMFPPKSTASVSVTTNAGSYEFTAAQATTAGTATNAQTSLVSSNVLGITNLTSSYIPKATGSSSLTNSQIIDDGTNVGIGKTPATKLDVNGTVSGSSFAGSSFRIYGSSSGYTDVKVPNAAGTNTIVLPNTMGVAGQIPQVDGAGNWTFTWLAATATNGGISSLNGLTNAQQTIAGTNGISVSSSGSTHVIGMSAGTLTAGTGLSGGAYNVTSNTTLSVVFGTTSGTAASGNDSRLSDNRYPTSHDYRTITNAPWMTNSFVFNRTSGKWAEIYITGEGSNRRIWLGQEFEPRYSSITMDNDVIKVDADTITMDAS